MGLAIGVIKAIGGALISFGVGAVTQNLIRVVTPRRAMKVVKLSMKLGSYFIAGVTSAAAGKKFSEDIDKAETFVKKFRVKKKPEQKVIEKEDNESPPDWQKDQPGEEA